MAIVENAGSVQLWYDQYLPPELGEVHKDTMQALFGLEITPEEAAARQEQAAKEYFGKWRQYRLPDPGGKSSSWPSC